MLCFGCEFPSGFFPSKPLPTKGSAGNVRVALPHTAVQVLLSLARSTRPTRTRTATATTHRHAHRLVVCAVPQRGAAAAASVARAYHCAARLVSESKDNCCAVHAVQRRAALCSAVQRCAVGVCPARRDATIDEAVATIDEAVVTIDEAVERALLVRPASSPIPSQAGHCSSGGTTAARAALMRTALRRPVRIDRRRHSSSPLGRRVTAIACVDRGTWRAYVHAHLGRRVAAIACVDRGTCACTYAHMYAHARAHLHVHARWAVMEQVGQSWTRRNPRVQVQWPACSRSTGRWLKGTACCRAPCKQRRQPEETGSREDAHTHMPYA